MRKLKTAGETIEIAITCTPQSEEALVAILSEIKRRGDPGHSFEITMDADSDEGPANLGWDGDGADYIKEVKVNGKKVL